MLSNLVAQVLAWLNAQPGSPRQPAAWLVGSLLLAVVATNLAWLTERLSSRAGSRRSRPGSVRGSQATAAVPSLAPLFWLIGALFMLLPPLLAWQRGAISPYLLGLTEIDWVADLRNGAVPAAAIAVIPVLGWLVYRRALRDPDGRLPVDVFAGTRRWTAPLDAGLRQWHWAFYRAAAIAWLAVTLARPGSALVLHLPAGVVLAAPHLDSASALYWGAWLGLAAGGIEWLLNPYARHSLRTPGRQEVALRDAALAVATTALFALTRNFWLCLAAQLFATTAMAFWWGEEEPAVAG